MVSSQKKDPRGRLKMTDFYYVNFLMNFNQKARASAQRAKKAMICHCNGHFESVQLSEYECKSDWEIDFLHVNSSLKTMQDSR